MPKSIPLWHSLDWHCLLYLPVKPWHMEPYSFKMTTVYLTHLLVARTSQSLSGYDFRALASGLWLPGSGHKTALEKAANKP